jgi:C4-dicarboxylate-specific signal transduction histidine kinase
LKRENLAWQELTESVKASLRPTFASQLGRVVFGSEKAVRIYADEVLLAQVLFNLVKNALEAGEGPVSLRAESTKKGVKIWVQDHGPGLSGEEAQKAFEPFYTSKSQGMGIGLYLSRKIIEAHGGSLSLQKDTEMGALFLIQLPGEKYA